jgi:hypothetical protein
MAQDTGCGSQAMAKAIALLVMWRINVTDLFKQERERRSPIAPWRPTAETLRRLIIVVGQSSQPGLLRSHGTKPK